MPRYMPEIMCTWDIEGRPDEVGSSYRFRKRLLGRDLEGRVEVVAVDVPRMQTTVTTYDNGTTVRWEMHIEPAPDHGTDGLDEIDDEVPPGLRYRIADRLLLKRTLEANLEQGAERIRQIVETEAHGA